MSDKKSNKKKYVSLAIGLIVSVGIIAFLVQSLDWTIFLRELDRVNYAYVPLLVLLFIAVFIVRAWRWRYLLPNSKELSTVKLFNATMVGFFATCILPFRAGEVIRPLVLSRWQPVSFSVGLASVVTERVFDVLALLFLMGLSISELENAPGFVSTGANALSVLAAVISAIMVTAYLRGDLIYRLIEYVIRACLEARFPEVTERLLQEAKGFIEGLRSISSLYELLAVLLWSLVLWGGMAMLYQVGLWTFGVYPSFWVGIAVTVILAFAVAAPSAPGFLGTFQLGCVASLSGLYGYSNEFAVAYSVVLHSYQVLLACLFGALILKREGLGLSQLRGGGKDTAISSEV
jgi:hypothetical protein